MDDAITDVDRDSEMQNNVWIAETSEATATLPTYSNKKWRQLQREDDILKRVIYYRDQGRIPTAAERKEERRDVVRLLCERVIIERNGLLYHKLDDSDNYQLLLPYSQRARVLENLHDDAGHQGIPRTEALVRERCYWLGIHNYVKEWINNCERCKVENASCTSENTTRTFNSNTTTTDCGHGLYCAGTFVRWQRICLGVDRCFH